MAESKSKNLKKSVVLVALYGDDYENELGSGCISFEKENVNTNSKLFIRVLAVGLLIINFVMSITLFPVRSLLTFLTNWGMLASFASILFLIYCASIPEIKQQKRKLCAAHLLFEFASILNLVIPIVYWGVIHAKVIHNFEGLRCVHMYTIHTLPTIGMFLTYKTLNISLCTHHWVFLAPIAILYSIINYYETKVRE